MYILRGISKRKNSGKIEIEAKYKQERIARKYVKKEVNSWKTRKFKNTKILMVINRRFLKIINALLLILGRVWWMTWSIFPVFFSSFLFQLSQTHLHLYRILRLIFISHLSYTKMEHHKLAFWSMVEYHFVKQHHNMQETRNNCFGNVAVTFRHSCLHGFAGRRVVLHFFDPKRLLRVSYILWCCFTKWYSTIPQNASFWCSIFVHIWIEK